MKDFIGFVLSLEELEKYSFQLRKFNI